ncbi:rod shape-determining protein MreC [Enterococcus rivorum]|uniref:Cell shape-determining protein MreC n=1 Tax=Enterococcus rivorum TaxID=762845 RepID=A0A1E5KUQ4_9ENTE|nr:rod shape-determining protein MreC [Enterococcus rivorum]MBP2099517.1 rod shape-determining protein MreC [Enterococcus rivorum]OEH81329.1 rod shape-determining protein MreC [Enterococcus rivorum]
MKKFNPNKNIIITLIMVIIVVTVISYTAAQRTNRGKTTLPQSAVNDSVGFVDKVLSFPARTIEGGVSSMSNLFNTYKENENLKEKIDSYGELAIQNENQKKEIDSLKAELGLNETLASYEKVPATVITRSPDTWQDLLIVDKGSNDGIEPNMAVLSKKGLVGRVIEVNATSSKVELLTSKNQNTNHFPARISSATGDAYGLIKLYDEKEKSLIVTQLTGDMEIKEGDIVQTSGLGGNSPANLPIGVVQKIKPDSYGLDREVFVKPYAEMYGISYVTIVKRLAGDGQ